MKKIIAFIVSKGNHPALHRNSLEIANSFQGLGCDVDYTYLNDPAAMQRAYDLMRSDEVWFSIGVNDTGALLQTAPDHYALGDLEVPYVSVLLDAPYNAANGELGFPCQKHYLWVLDKSHIGAIKYRFPDKKFAGEIFQPLGGDVAKNEDDIFSADRDLDVVFSASMFEDGNIREYWREQTDNPYIIGILDDVVEYMLANPVSLLPAVKNVLEDRGLIGEDYVIALAPYFHGVFFYVKMKRRYRTLEALADKGLQVEVFGPGWENVPFAQELQLHGQVSYETVLDAFSRAKVVVQDQAEFNNGGHDRVFTAMLNGAVVVSEYSSYLAEQFEDGMDMYMFDWKNTVSQMEIVEELLNNESKRLASAIRAYGKAKANHRWENRAQRVLEMMSL
ncbi:glycosyltransferase [Anaerovibrio sp.]|uniref:glycosyltransferase family protein n=1 Tax=Anaerovibrio sp. TaxID=1872532 RepID=UPI0025C24C8D|nr:glycosyltransferase [Anaerovibrio sp.]MBR2142015.1 glycosyltransferase family 1 protein [Anaerovibrio sp.]